MRKFKMVAVVSVMAFIFGLLGPVQEVNAACNVHSDYKDRVISSSSPNFSSHYVETGYYVDGKPITQKCNITTVYITPGVYCGVCGMQMSTYTQTVVNHSISH